METESQSDSSKAVDRRRFLQAMSATGAVAAAGCSGDSGNGSSGDVEGERVPELEIHYWSTSSYAFQPVIEIAESTLDELGISASSSPSELATNVSDILNDAQNMDMALWGQPNQPGKADPMDLLDGFAIQFAGADTANGNWANWANCEYSEKVTEVAFATDIEEQTQYTQEAAEIMSESGAVIPIVGNAGFGAYRSDRVEPGPIGIGLGRLNPSFYLQMGAIDQDTITCDMLVSSLQQEDFTAGPTSPTIESHLISSGLISVDEEFNLVGELAEDWESSDDGTSYTFTLVDDATYHNGDPITAEEVKWSYEFYQETHDRSPVRNNLPYTDEGIEVVDDRTIRFNFERPYLSLLNKHLVRWGVLHPPTWEAVREDPENNDPAEPFVGSGPFQLDNFEAERSMTMSPYGDHPVYSPDYNVVFRGFRNQSSRTEAFLNGELDVISNLDGAGLERVEEQLADVTETVTIQPFTTYYFLPQCSTPTSKFKEFRRAFATAFNRQQANDVVFLGRSEPQMHGCIYTGNHPQVDADALPTFTDDPTGDVEAARGILEDAGWQWDGDGNLHYPPDADTGPAWPQGEGPDPDEFDCLNDDGSYAGPSI